MTAKSVVLKPAALRPASGEHGDVGGTIDLLEIHLNKCQLGLFGYSPKKMIVKPAENVTLDWKQPSVKPS